MKKIILFSCFLITQIMVSQETNKIVDLKNVQIVNSTALALLDNTAAVITSNPDCKDFSINTENLSNISFDVSLNKGKLSGLEYYGLGNSTADFKQVTTDKLLRPNVSGVVTKNDSTANIAIGFNVNVLTVFRVNKEKMDSSFRIMTKSAKELNSLADAIMAEKYPQYDKFTNPEKYLEQRNKVLDSIPTKISDEFAEILRKPLLMLDVASAYSILYPNNTFKDNQPDRLGVWSTLTACGKLAGKNNYINFYGFIRYLEDKAVYNKVNLNYDDHMKYFDFGGKVQLDFNDLSIGYEYIKRNGNGKDYRSVGMIQYKVTADVYLTGGFGKNFTSDSDKDLVSLFGIRWGINKKDIRESKVN